MCQIVPTASCLYPDDCPQNSRIWGAVLSAPTPMKTKLFVPKGKKCKKCGAYVNPQDGSCPICNPQASMELISDFSIGSQVEKKQRSIFCIAFDLLLPHKYIKEMIGILSTSNFLSSQSDSLFMFVFLGKVPIYVLQESGTIHLSFSNFNFPDAKYFFSSSEVPLILSESTLILPTAKNYKISEEELNHFMQEISGLSISSLILLHTFSLPQLKDLPFTTHTILFSTQESPLSFTINSCINNSWTMANSNQASTYLLDYLSMLFEKTTPKKVNIELKTSEGLEFNWMSTSFAEKNISGRKIDLQLTSFPHFSSFAVSLCSNSNFPKHKVFAIQCVTYFSDKIIVNNRFYTKADTLLQWLDLSNPMAIASIFARQSAAHKLLVKKRGLFDRTYTWQLKNIFNVQGLLLSKLLNKISENMNTLLFDDQALLPQDIREVILFQLMTHSFSYNVDFANSMIGNQKTTPTNDFIYVPPFIFCEDTKQCTYSEVKKKQDNEIVPFIYVLDKALYKKIKDRLTC